MTVSCSSLVWQTFRPVSKSFMIGPISSYENLELKSAFVFLDVVGLNLAAQRGVVFWVGWCTSGLNKAAQLGDWFCVGWCTSEAAFRLLKDGFVNSGKFFMSFLGAGVGLPRFLLLEAASLLLISKKSFLLGQLAEVEM